MNQVRGRGCSLPCHWKGDGSATNVRKQFSGGRRLQAKRTIIILLVDDFPANLTVMSMQQALSRFPLTVGEKIDLQEIQALAGQQSEMVTLMLKQMLEGDLQRLNPLQPEAEEVARIVHRLKASWNLLCLHHAERFCLTMEKLPALLAAGDIQKSELPQLLTGFINEMRRYQQLLLTSELITDG